MKIANIFFLIGFTKKSQVPFFQGAQSNQSEVSKIKIKFAKKTIWRLFQKWLLTSTFILDIELVPSESDYTFRPCEMEMRQLFLTYF
jgi:hypothetical protein